MAECLESVLDAKPDWGSYDENWVDQSDEMLAVNSYYEGTDVFDILEEASKENNEIFKLQLNLPVKTPEIKLKAEVWITTQDLEPLLTPEPNDSTDNEATTSKPPQVAKNSAKFERTISGRNAHTSINCDYLPNINFSVTLPCTYPSQTAPNYTLSASWLNSSQLEDVCKELDKIWIENDNMPILFTWSEWLSSSLIEFLDILMEPNTVIITPVCIDKFQKTFVDDYVPDKRAISTFENVDDLIYNFLRHNYVEEIKAFGRSMQTCMICFDEKLGSDFYRLNDCRHHFCQECMTDMCRMHAKEGTIQLLKCPESGCEENVSFDIMQQCLSDSEFERLERLMLQKTLDSMGDVMYCPQCSLPIITEKTDTHAMCLSCMVDFCQLCKDKWHSGACGQVMEEKLKTLQIDMADLMKLTDEDIKLRLGDSNSVLALKKKIKAKQDDSFMKKFKTCPQCRAPIDRYSGCNKVTCICGCVMCYICCKRIKGYDHFSNGDCGLWVGTANAGEPRVPIPQRNQIQEAMRRVIDVAPEQRKNIIKCPSCHQRILRQNNNNHLKCLLCHNNVCFCCKKKLVGNVTDHFKNSTCKQHD